MEYRAAVLLVKLNSHNPSTISRNDTPDTDKPAALNLNLSNCLPFFFRKLSSHQISQLSGSIWLTDPKKKAGKGEHYAGFSNYCLSRSLETFPYKIKCTKIFLHRHEGGEKKVGRVSCESPLLGQLEFKSPR